MSVDTEGMVRHQASDRVPGHPARASYTCIVIGDITLYSLVEAGAGSILAQARNTPKWLRCPASFPLGILSAELP